MPAPDVRPDVRFVALLVAAVLLSVLFGYAETGRSMVKTWRSSETFSHGFVVVPIALWLVWRRREEIARLPAAPFWPGLLLLAMTGIVWMLGRLGNARVVEQYALVVILQSAVLAVLGPRFVRAVAFPLLFLFFAVPFGDALVPHLIDWTADFTVLALKLSGVPVYREGNYFAIPSGQWSVVEACSGIRYLVASLMAGTLYAYLMYRGVWRRVAFIAAALVVPIVANWLRAYLIVMVGHLSDNILATGIDHLIYGWIFFGVVLGSLFWVGTKFRDNGTMRDAAAGRGQHPTGAAARAALAGAALATVLVSGPWPLLGAALAAASGHSERRALPAIEGVDGWQVVADAALDWQPRFSGQRASVRQVFERAGERVAVHIAYYAGQTEGAELVSSRNTLVAAADPHWRQIATRRIVLEGRDGTWPARLATIEAADGRFDVLWWYWVAGATTANDSAATGLLVWSRLRLQGDDAAAVFLFTEPSERSDGTRLLQRFAADMREAIEHALAVTRDRTPR